MTIDVFGLENPLIDLLAQVPDALLRELGLEKNKMYLVDASRQREVLEKLAEQDLTEEPGGSCANTLLGLAQLGVRTAYCGKVGEDAHGEVYLNKLEAAGVRTFMSATGEAPTGSSLVLVTPDGARTMNTLLGACQHLGPQDLPLEVLGSARLLYLTGYLWDTPTQQEAARLALNRAKEKGMTVAMSLADPFCVSRHAQDFIDLLKSHVQLVFANREEAMQLTGSNNSQQALQLLREWCGQAVVTLGAHGALVAEGTEQVYIDPFLVEVVDTTGAGDAFAAGYLYGYIQGVGLLQRGRLGSGFAAQVIQRIGPRLSGDVRSTLAPLLEQNRS